MLDFTSGRMQLMHNAGIGGEDTGQMLARISTDVVAYKPDMCIVMGGTNDLVARAWPATTTMSNLKSIFSALQAAGITPVACTIPPRNSITAAQYAEYQKLNLFLKLYCATNRLHLLDFHGLLVNATTGAWAVSGNTADGVHPTDVGATIMGKYAADTLLPYLPISPGWLEDVDDLAENSAVNMLLNGLFLRDVAGTLNSWSKSVPSYNLLAATNGLLGRWMEINNPATGGSVSQTITTGFTVGDTLVFSGCYQIDSLGASGATVTIQVAFRDNTTTEFQWWNPVRQTVGTTPTGYLPKFYISGQIPTGTVSIRVYAWVISAAGPVCRSGQFTLLNLTRLGIDLSAGALYTRVRTAGDWKDWPDPASHVVTGTELEKIDQAIFDLKTQLGQA